MELINLKLLNDSVGNFLFILKIGFLCIGYNEIPNLLSFIHSVYYFKIVSCCFIELFMELLRGKSLIFNYETVLCTVVEQYNSFKSIF